jgi:MoxR-like ATPase
MSCESVESSVGAAAIKRVTEQIGSRIVGQSAVIELLLVALLCEGHVLIEDVPGTGKTALAKALAQALSISFRRIQFTPDLLPSDVIGSSVFDQRNADFVFRPGPLFGQVILADEINRATPRTQSALLEAMEERQVTADGTTMPLPRPFMVIATQNPIELEGTFPLPEAQLDRFLLRLSLGYPDLEAERAIVLRQRELAVPAADSCGLTAQELASLAHGAQAVLVSETVHTYMLELVRATRSWSGVALGASPRASIGLYRCAQALAWLRGRSYVLPDDVKLLAPSVLAHRILLSHEARAKALTSPLIVQQILTRVDVPVESAEEPRARARDAHA